MAPHLYLAERGRGGANARPAHSPIRVVVADGHALVRRGLTLLLAGERDVEVVAEVADLRGVDGHLRRHAPDVLVLEVELPGGAGLDLIRRLRVRFPDTEIVALTMEHSPAFAERALDSDAVGFVLKEFADSDLTAAVRAAARGEEFVSPHVAARLEARRQDLLAPSLQAVLRPTSG